MEIISLISVTISSGIFWEWSILSIPKNIKNDINLVYATPIINPSLVACLFGVFKTTAATTSDLRLTVDHETDCAATIADENKLCHDDVKNISSRCHGSVSVCSLGGHLGTMYILHSLLSLGFTPEICLINKLSSWKSLLLLVSASYFHCQTFLLYLLPVKVTRPT